MKLLFLIGAQAVGKMTVGQEIARRTPMKLFHNHMTIEPVIELFGAYNGAVTERLRRVIFEEFPKSDNYGMIFTYVWAFDQQADWDYVAWVTKLFEDAGATVDYVELIADRDVRMARNRTENRLAEKPSKRNVELSDYLLAHAEEKYRCVSEPGEIPYERYLRLHTDDLSPAETAESIIDRFGYDRI